MEPFTTLTAVAMPLGIPNIDTDQIIPARFLGRPRTEQVTAMFHDLRYDADGKPRTDSILNAPAYAGAAILVADENLGCGSSRESAVTVMLDNGYRAFIAPSFGDIFYNNCLQNGALPIRLPGERVTQLRALLHHSPGAELSIDLPAQTVRGPDGRTDTFEIDPFRKECLVQGLDAINLTLGLEPEIRQFEERQRQEMPWL
jgi:3-isopropylmalate/(R)-2-methylmalate dehydratase small subunit